MIVFRKQACMDDNCECFQSPIKAKEPFEKLLQNEKYLFPTITPDPDRQGHYMTYDQLMDAREHSTAGAYFDTWRSFGSCKSCKYVFSSVKDATRHKAQIHGGKRAYDSMDVDEGERQYICPLCNTSYPTQYMKYRHQQERGHMMDRGRPVNGLNLTLE